MTWPCWCPATTRFCLTEPTLDMRAFLEEESKLCPNISSNIEAWEPNIRPFSIRTQSKLLCPDSLIINLVRKG